MRRCLVLLLAVTQLAAAPAAAQRIRGIVTDIATDQPVAEATIVVLDRDHVVRATANSNAAGIFLVRPPNADSVRVRVVRLGYGVVESPLFAVPGRRDTMHLTVNLEPQAITLEQVTATVTARVNRNRAGFQDRRRSGFGRYLGPEDIARRRPTRASDLLTGFPGFTTAYVNGRPVPTVRSRGRNCIPAVYLDGFPLPAEDLDWAAPASMLRGLEVYQSAELAPVQFQGFGGNRSCGVIVAWTDFGFGEFGVDRRAR